MCAENHVLFRRPSHILTQDTDWWGSPARNAGLPFSERRAGYPSPLSHPQFWILLLSIAMKGSPKALQPCDTGFF